MTYTLCMGAISMGVKKDIIDITGTTLFDITDKTTGSEWFYLYRRNIKRVNIDFSGSERYRNVMWFG